MTEERDTAIADIWDRYNITAIDRGRFAPEMVDAYEAGRASVSPVTEPDTAHDHSGEPKVWCLTHNHTHIASIPRFTFHCKSCGYGGWYKPGADEHERLCLGHETYEVEHVIATEPHTDKRSPLRKIMDERADREMQDAFDRFKAHTEEGYAPVFSDQECVVEYVHDLREQLALRGSRTEPEAAIRQEVQP